MNYFSKREANPLKNIDKPEANPLSKASVTPICFSFIETEVGTMKKDSWETNAVTYATLSLPTSWRVVC